MQRASWHCWRVTYLGLTLGAIVCAGSITLLAGAWPAQAEAPSDQSDEVWRTSPYHGAIDGATGLPIPCLCRFSGRDFKVGERVCMTTAQGVVITRCDLFQNNTTWVPTKEACTLASRPRPQRTAAKF